MKTWEKITLVFLFFLLLAILIPIAYITLASDIIVLGGLPV